MLVIKVDEQTRTYRVYEMTAYMSRTHIAATSYSAKKVLREFLTKYFKDYDNENIPTYRLKI